MSKDQANENTSKTKSINRNFGATKKEPQDNKKTKPRNVGFSNSEKIRNSTRDHQRGSSLNSDNRSEAYSEKENQQKMKRARSQSTSSVYHGSGKMLRFQMLSYENIQCLEEMLKSQMKFSSRHSNFPALQMTLKELTTAVKIGLEREDIHVKDIRIGGNGAGYVFVDKSQWEVKCNSLELIFNVDCSGTPALNLIRSIVLQTLIDFVPEFGPNKKLISENIIKETYIHKMIRVNNSSHDCWSLLSLGNPLMPDETIVDIKFVSRMKRKFEFTVDSFQIVLDSMLSFLEKSTQPLSEHFYPPVVSECTSGDFEESLHHLNYRLIATRNPEEIRGGGLLKYCNLLVEGYKAVDVRQMSSVERYMCSRFFIDFPDSSSQLKKLESHLLYHYSLEESQQAVFLRTLRRIIDKSTVCLTQQERRRTLRLIDYFIQRVTNKENSTHSSVIELKEFDSQNWILDQVFYGTSYFPQEIYVQCTVPAAFHGPTVVSANNVEGPLALVEGEFPPENDSSESIHSLEAQQCAPSYKSHLLGAGAYNEIPVLVQSQS